MRLENDMVFNKKKIYISHNSNCKIFFWKDLIVYYIITVFLKKTIISTIKLKGVYVVICTVVWKVNIFTTPISTTFKYPTGSAWIYLWNMGKQKQQPKLII